MQNKSRQRKLLWAGAIAVLFFAMLLHRPTVEAAAKENSVQAANLGEVDLGGSITRFVLTSFRGPLICGLWWEARNAQAKHEYEQMQLVIRALTKLQPHYRGPWRYEAWNLAYNVAVEFDSVQDKYFFVSQGIRWLVDGERINRQNLYDPAIGQLRKVGDPDMREEVGVYTQDKFSLSDEAQLFRVLLQLSCIPPERRNLDQLRNNPQALADFKAAYPQFVRRVRDYRFIAEGADDTLDKELLAFIERHQDQPGLHPTRAELARGRAKPENEFPFWPEDDVGDWKRPANPGLEPNQDCYEIARQWYDFSIEPLPPASAEEAAGIRRSQALTRENKGKQSIIFRANPARAKSHNAMQYAKEGWSAQSQQAWEIAYGLWRKFGSQNALELNDEETKDLTAKAKFYVSRFPALAQEGKPPPSYLADENKQLYQQLSEGYHAFSRLKGMEGRRSTSNYQYWRVASDAGRTEDSRQARQLWYDAARRRSDLSQALALQDSSMPYWRRLLRSDDAIAPELDLGHRLAMMLSPGPAPALCLSTLRLPAPTAYAANNQVQEGLYDLNDQYLAVKSAVRAPNQLRAYLIASEAVSLIGRQACSPGGQFGAVGALPIGVTPLHIEDSEDVIQLGAGPFDPYISGTIKEAKASRERLIRRQRLDGTPPQETPAAPASAAPVRIPSDGLPQR